MKEYKVIETKKSQAETIMNEMAAQGWEVVSMTYIGMHGRFLC